MRLLASALVVLALLAGCGYGDDDASSTTTVVPATWSGPPEAAEDGTISVAGFNEYAQQELSAEDRVPRELAIEFLQVQEPYEVTVDTSRAGGATVMVLKDDLEDDSVRAQRYTLEFGLFSGGVVKLTEARVDYMCQPNRGHQDFSPELCL